MAAGTRDLNLEQGATSRFALQWLQPTEPKVPYDLTGAEAWMQVRNSAGEVVIDLRDGAGIEFDAANGFIRVTMTADQTWELTTKRVRYDLFVKLSGGDVVKLLKGRGFVDKAITDYRADDDSTPISDGTVLEVDYIILNEVTL